MNSGMSQSYTTQRDHNISKLAGYAATGQRYEERNSEANATLTNQVRIFLFVVFNDLTIVPSYNSSSK